MIVKWLLLVVAEGSCVRLAKVPADRFLASRSKEWTLLKSNSTKYEVRRGDPPTTIVRPYVEEIGEHAGIDAYAYSGFVAQVARGMYWIPDRKNAKGMWTYLTRREDQAWIDAGTFDVIHTQIDDRQWQQWTENVVEICIVVNS